MNGNIKKFKLANVLLVYAIALALSGCGDDDMNPDYKPPVVDPNPPVDPTPPYGDDFVIFQDKVNTYWPAWDCCGGTTPLNPNEGGSYGLVTEFAVGDTPAVLGFVRADSKGPLDISAYEAQGTLEFDIKLVKAPAGGATSWLVKLESNGGTNDENPGQAVEVAMTAPTSAWQKVKVNIADLANQGLDLTSVDNVLIFPQWDTGAGAVYRVDNVKFVIDGNSGEEPDPEEPLPNPDVDKGLKFDLTKEATDFGGTASELVVNPAPAFSLTNRAVGQVVKTLKTDGAETWAGTTLGDKPVIAFADNRSKISVWVYSEHASTKLRLKVENQLDAAKNVEADAFTTVANEWEKITFDFANPAGAAIDPSATYDMTSIFFDFDQPGSGKVFYWQDMTFVEAEVTDPTPDPEPEPDPDEERITIFNDAANPQWAAWDCCGGSTPAVIQDSDPAHGAVTAFEINGATVAGFTARNDAGAVNGSPLDVSAWQETGTVSFDLKLTNDAGATDWKFKVESVGGGAVELSLPDVPTLNTWKTYQFNLKDLAAKGIDLSKVDLVLMFPAWGSGIGSTYSVDNLVFSSKGYQGEEPEEPLPPADNTGNLVSNGDFTSGNLDPWFQVGAGTVNIKNGAVFTSAVNGGEARIKQVSIGQGELTAGESVTLSYKLKGKATDGGVINGIVHTISAANAVSATKEISIPAPTNEWVQHSVTFNIGPDEGMGVDLMLGGVCGAVASCEATAEFDDIKIIKGGAPIPPDPEVPNPEEPGPDGENLLLNGSFATTDLAPWFQIGAGNVQIVDGAVRTSATAGGEARIKQTFIGKDKLTDNQSVTLKLRMKGKLTDGGAINGIVHTVSATGVTKTDVIELPAPTAEWVDFSKTFNIGNDPAHGLDLTLGGVCGAVGGCEATVDFDDIRIIAN
ncbi:carbohydrate binding domain-containing protein [Aeromonas veronii]|uniref:carbohydrate binding domain-containing protein n=1 Tax=Aeromonas veronii TaxID=654 RepID=UPI003F79EB1A